MDNLILVVDDEKLITTTLSTLIKMVLKSPVKSYNNPIDALNSNEILQNKVDVIISDFMMPGMNGIEFLKNVKRTSPNSIPILLTGYADKESAINSINEVGLYYYMEKPWDNNSLIKVIQNALEKKNLCDTLEQKYDELDNSKKEIERLYELLKLDYQIEMENSKNLIISLANVIEAKDQYTDGHTRRVSLISKKIGQKMNLSPDQIYNIEISGLIHDIGKVGIPESILNKPGRLDYDEYEKIKEHTIIGENICKPLNCIKSCLDPIRHHHEKLDGSGYPDGLKENEISIEARIIAVADIFDALISNRPYRSQLPLNEARDILLDQAKKKCLDISIVYTLFSIIDNNELQGIY